MIDALSEHIYHLLGGDMDNGNMGNAAESSSNFITSPGKPERGLQRWDVSEMVEAKVSLSGSLLAEATKQLMYAAEVSLFPEANQLRVLPDIVRFPPGDEQTLD